MFTGSCLPQHIIVRHVLTITATLLHLILVAVESVTTTCVSYVCCPLYQQ